MEPQTEGRVSVAQAATPVFVRNLPQVSQFVHYSDPCVLRSAGKRFDYRDRLTDVWMKIDGPWKLIASPYSLAPS